MPTYQLSKGETYQFALSNNAPVLVGGSAHDGLMQRFGGGILISGSNLSPQNDFLIVDSTQAGYLANWPGCQIVSAADIVNPIQNSNYVHEFQLDLVNRDTSAGNFAGMCFRVGTN